MPDRDPSRSGEDLLDRAVRAWRKAQVVHYGLSRDGRPEATALAEEVARRAEFEPSLFDLLGDPSPLVAAHSLMALELMGSGGLQGLPAELLADRSKIAMQVGSVRIDADLGGLAREIQRRARRRRRTPLTGGGPTSLE